MKKKISLILLYLWAAGLIGLGVWYLSPYASGEAVSVNENRTLQDRPAFTWESYFSGEFADQVEDWLSDRFPGREGTVSAYHGLLDTLSAATMNDILEISHMEDASAAEEADEETINELAAVFDTQKAEEDAAAPAQSADKEEQQTDVPEAEGTEAAEETAAAEEEAETPAVPPDPNDYPLTYCVRVAYEGYSRDYFTYTRNQVLSVTAVMNMVAAVLPEDGVLVYTTVPDSTIGAKYVNGTAYAREAAESGSTEDAFAGTEFLSEAEELVGVFGADNVYAVNAVEILKETIDGGGYCYYRTDFHWTPYGAYPVYCAMVEKAGLTPASWDDFDLYTEENFLGSWYRNQQIAEMRSNPDTLTVLQPRFPIEFRKITRKDTYEVVPMLDLDAASNDRYCVNLGGPGGPWKYAVCDNGIERKCLMITDSFGLTMFPMLCENYGEVHYYDARYYRDDVGYSVAEMIEKYGISDVYVVLGTADSYDSGYSTDYLRYHLG